MLKPLRFPLPLQGFLAFGSDRVLLKPVILALAKHVRI